jgi:hypothetical protein
VSEHSERPILSIVRGEPTPEEVAVVTAVVTVAASATSDVSAPPGRGGWNDRAAAQRRPLLPGPGAWRASAAR